MKSKDGKYLFHLEIDDVKKHLKENVESFAVGVQVHPDGGRRFVIAKNNDCLVDVLTSASGEQFEMIHRLSIQHHSHEIFKPKFPSRLFFETDADCRFSDEPKRIKTSVNALLAFLESCGIVIPFDQSRYIVFNACDASILSYHVIFPEVIFPSVEMIGVLVNDFADFVESECSFPPDLMEKYMLPEDWPFLVTLKAKILMDRQVYVPFRSLRLPCMYKLAEHFKRERPLELDKGCTCSKYKNLDKNPRQILYLGSIQFGIYGEVVERWMPPDSKNQDHWIKHVFEPEIAMVDCNMDIGDFKGPSRPNYNLGDESMVSILNTVYANTPIKNFWKLEDIRALPKYGLWWSVKDATSTDTHFCPRRYLASLGVCNGREGKYIPSISNADIQNPIFHHNHGNINFNVTKYGTVKIKCFSAKKCTNSWDDDKKCVSLGKYSVVADALRDIGIIVDEKKVVNEAVGEKKVVNEVGDGKEVIPSVEVMNQSDFVMEHHEDPIDLPKVVVKQEPPFQNAPKPTINKTSTVTKTKEPLPNKPTVSITKSILLNRYKNGYDAAFERKLGRKECKLKFTKFRKKKK